MKKISIILLTYIICLSLFASNLENLFFKDKKIDFISNFLHIAKIKYKINLYLTKPDINFNKKEKLLLNLDEITKLENNMIENIFLKEPNTSKKIIFILNKIKKLNLSPENIDLFFIKPILNAIIIASKNYNVIIPDNDFKYINNLIYEINKREIDGYYISKLKKITFSQFDLVIFTSLTKESITIKYFDLKNLTLKNKTLRIGDSFLNYTLLNISGSILTFLNTHTHEQFNINLSENTLKIFFTPIVRNNKNFYKIVPVFKNGNTIKCEKGGMAIFYLKVIDNNENTIKDAEIMLGKYTFKANKNGIIRIPIDTNKIHGNYLEFTVKYKNSYEKFKVEIKPTFSMIKYNASLGTNIGIGAGIILAGASVAVNPSYSVGLSFFCKDISNKYKDKIVFTTTPQVAVSLKASLGPKLKPFSISAFDYNLGAELSAGINASGKLSTSISHTWVFNNPYTYDKKAECVLLADQLLNFAPIFKPIVSSAIAKISNVNIDDYMSSASLKVIGEANISGNISSHLGLVNISDDNTQSLTTGINANLINGSASLSAGISGGIINGFTPWGSTKDKYSVALESNINGNFSLGKLSMKIAGIKLLPDYWLTNKSGSTSLLTIFRFDKNKNLTKCMIIISTGYKITENVYDKTLKKLRSELKQNGANTSDYLEIYKAKGVEKQYIFFLNKNDVKKHLKEWYIFSKSLLTQTNPQNKHTVVARIKNMFPTIAKSFRKLFKYPVFFIERTTLILDNISPNISFSLDMGINIDLGIDTSFTKSKTFTTKMGYVSNFEFYPFEIEKYRPEIARADREIDYLINTLKEYLKEEMKNTASYVYQKAKDGTIYIAQKLKDGTLNIIKISKNGVISITKATGEKAKEIWNSIISTIGDAAEYCYEAGTEIISSIGNYLSDLWNSL